MSENFEMVAKTFQGLEGVLSDELKELGAQDVQQGKRMVSFTGDKEMMYRANFCLRTALRVLKPIYKFRSADADDLYEKVKRFDWSTIMRATDTFAIDSTVYSESFRHSRFVTYRVKDAIADYFMEAEGRRPSIRLNAPDLRLDVHISGDEVTLSLDSSGEPLYKRGWRVAQTDAPINEVLAAGIIKLSGWHGQCNLVDPMCGSGTFLIEAALIAANINPGVYRNDFAFQHWSDYDPELYSKIYNDDSGEREFNYKIYGSDIAVQAVAIAEANVKNAGLGKMIEVKQQDLRELEEAPEKGYVITNPPYGERLKLDDIEGLYETIGQKLKKVFRGYQAWLITYDKELTSLIGLHPSVTYPLLNGDLECELREYVIFDGSYKDMKRAGGSLRNEGFRASDRDRGARRPFKETYGDDSDADAEGHDDGGKPRRRFDRDKKGRFDRDGGKPRRFDRDKKGRFDRDGGKPRRFDRDKKGRGDRDDEQPRKPRRFDRHRDERDRRREQRREERHERHEGLLDRDAFFHSEKFARQVLQHREPTLGKDAEVPIVHGRRKGWKRKGDSGSGNSGKEGNNPAPEGGEQQ